VPRAHAIIGNAPSLWLSGWYGRRQAIPVVFAGVAEPVASGLVPRLNRPGGNVTGFATLDAGPIWFKRVAIFLR
jgi:hypothetical protein